MNQIKKFEDFINEGTVKRQTPNKSRAEFLLKESEKDYSFLLELLDKIGLTDDNANSFIKSCYDILMETVRARMLLEGYNASGYGAHEAEVAYLNVLGFDEEDIRFADKMRYFRNGMLYYGTILDKEYAEKVIAFTKKHYKTLKDLSLQEKNKKAETDNKK